MAEEKKYELATTEQSLRPRPWWQRIVYPIVGGILIIGGIIGWLLPVIPGFPLIIVGIPLAVCFNARLELWVRREMHRGWHRVRDAIRRRWKALD